LTTTPYAILDDELNVLSVVEIVVPPVWLLVAYCTIAPEPFVPEVSTLPNSVIDQLQRDCAALNVIVTEPVVGLDPIARNSTTPLFPLPLPSNWSAT
jgi:hypothetical protein